MVGGKAPRVPIEQGACDCRVGRMKLLPIILLLATPIAGRAAVPNAWWRGKPRFSIHVIAKGKGGNGQRVPCMFCKRPVVGTNKSVSLEPAKCVTCKTMQGSVPDKAFLLHLWRISQSKPWEKGK